MSSYLTRVALKFVPQQVNVWLKFGKPILELRKDSSLRYALFEPGQIFCRLAWFANEFGTTQWTLMILKAARLGEPVSVIEGVMPGAQVLLRLSGQPRVLQVLDWFDDLERAGAQLPELPESFWQMAHHRLQARLPLPIFTPERQRAVLRVSAALSEFGNCEANRS